MVDKPSNRAQFNLAAVHEALGEALADRTCIVHRDRRLTWADVTDRTRRLANYLRGRGLGAHVPRAQLANHESGQDHLAIYQYNGPEYLESMVAAWKARVAPFNVNYRYVDSELIYLLRDACARAIVYHASFAPTLERVRPQLPQLEVLLQIADESGHALLPGAVDYEAALASVPAERPELEWSPDDLYILYTGGTTGMPKGVLWRQHDAFLGALGGRTRDGRSPRSLAEVIERARSGPGHRVLATPPMMHGAGHWTSFVAWHGGGTVVIQDNVQRLDAHDVLRTAAREQTGALLLVGDAFGRPIVDALREQRYELPELRLVISSGAALHPTLKEQLLELLPGVLLLDAVGSSEAGSQGYQLNTRGTSIAPGTFELAQGACVLDSELTRRLEPGHDGVGWLAQSGNVPLGYLGDADKTQRTFPVVGGVRYSVPGDRARILPNGRLELLGRDSVTINSGGEKIYAEEIERALKQHPAVYDAVVCGRESERWGQEVCAVVQLREGAVTTVESLLLECGKHLARFKLPKVVLFRDQIVRSPSGKADYRWARMQVSG
jgi:acyl-CoA synthetase (AMP-forming)/AMP-acid ligase II